MLPRLLLASTFIAASLSAQFSIEQALSSAFPSQMVSSPKAGRVAWVATRNGPWNVWVAAGPGFAARQLTGYTGDDGQEISQLALAPGGERLLFVRGGGPNRAGEAPNPTSGVQGAEQSVWLLEWSGGAPRRLGEGHSPSFSPDGRMAVWLHLGAVWSADLSSDAKAAPLFKARGSASDLAFSPDGSKLAFSSSRADHAFIGVYDLGAKTVTWLDPSTDRDMLPVWAPDGLRLAFLRVPSERPAQPFGARRAAAPWSIRVASLPSGAAREIFRAEPGRGSVFQPVAAGPSLVWTSTGHLVFPWERTGWKLLYAVPAASGSPLLLTPGEFEVEFVEPAPDGASLVISSNQDDIARRHLWRVDVASARVTRLTQGDGIEWAPCSLAGGEVAFLRSDARRPARPALLAASGAIRDLSPSPVPADFPQQEFVPPLPVKFPATDGMEIPAQLFLPRGLKAGERRPAVVFLHGGSRRQMLLGWNPMYYYHNAYAFNQYLVSRGYIVLSVNYRSGTGYGLEFREALDYGAAGASEFQDVLGAGLYLRSRADVDARRIALWGGSYGGYLTALGLARASALFAAGVDLHGVHDWVRDIQDTRPAALPLNQDFQRLAWESSPMSSVSSWRSPVLLIHGDDDRNVVFNQSVQLVEELRKRGVEYELLVFPDEVHDFLLHENWLRAFRAAAGFFERKLGR
jgi:dipeptidyl aminopeptidase/acylaminoacyl peptidase